jgi:hypothetical protein
LTSRRAIGAIVVHLEFAWQRVLSAHPQVALHDKDNSHPNFEHSHRAACVFFAALFGGNPAEWHAAHVPEVDRIGTNVARVLRDAAWQTVRMLE